jgi:RNA polymerase sigma factor (sigma-70 family)
MNVAERDDADLVAESLAGSRDAFRAIVERYQTLICSLAYNATGNVSQSEDVAQETFLAAWTDLRSLREPPKLRAWLCGIVRNRIQKSLRREGREPALNAAPLDDARESPACEALPSEQAISREEEALLWRSLEKIPELYREPLILFYRQNQSVELVAEALELSEDAVKQRLARGRKLLQEEVQAFVENTLGRTAPGRGFSGAVIAGLPLLASPAATAGLGAGVKGTAAVKSGFLAAWMGPFLGFFAGFMAQWMVVRATTTGRERGAKLFRLVITWICLLGIPIVGETSVRWLGLHFGWSDRACFASVAGFWGFWCILLATWLILAFRREIAIRLHNDAPEIPMAPGMSALVGVGCYLTIFLWLICLAWRENDRMGAALITGAMLVLMVWNILQNRGASGVVAARTNYSRMTLSCAVVVAFINLRLDVWAATKYGVSVTEAHNLLPIWIVPLLTFALVAWIGVLLALTKPSMSR